MADHDPTQGSRGRRPWRCRIGLHRYYRTTNDTGEPYLVCRGCQRVDVPSISMHGGGDAG